MASSYCLKMVLIAATSDSALRASSATGSACCSGCAAQADSTIATGDNKMNRRFTRPPPFRRPKSALHGMSLLDERLQFYCRRPRYSMGRLLLCDACEELRVRVESRTNLFVPFDFEVTKDRRNSSYDARAHRVRLTTILSKCVNPMMQVYLESKRRQSKLKALPLRVLGCPAWPRSERCIPGSSETGHRTSSTTYARIAVISRTAR